MVEPVSVRIDGERYEATVPNTLDLAERAELALNGLGGTVDPEREYNMYFWIHYYARPPYMMHWGFDGTCDPKFAESFPLMRTITGSKTHVEAEAGLMAALVRRLSAEDGLYYSVATLNRPWHALGHKGYAAVAEDFANVAGNGRMLRTMVTWYERDSDPAWAALIRALARGLDRIAIHVDGYAYYPDGGFGEAFSHPRSGWQHTHEPLGPHEGGEGDVVSYHGHQVQGLARWYQLSGDESVLDLARKLTNFMIQPRFWGGEPEPTGVAGDEKGHFDTHFHARAVGLRGILEYAMIAGSPRLKEFVRSSYEYGRMLGIPAIGWYPSLNWYLSPGGGYCEGCTLGDMVALGIRLSDAGVGDYWDDVDQLVRNQLAATQLTRADLLQQVAAAGLERPPGSQWWTRGAQGYAPQKIYPGQEVTENVIARSLGVFGSHSTPTSVPDCWVMQCCTGNATQGLYYAWEGIVRCADGENAQVNLLLNRASPWLDIDSALPYEGRVVLHNKTAARVSVRMPSWVPRRQLRLWVNAEERRQRWAGSYVQIDDLKPGDRVVLEFPVIEWTAQYTALARMWRVEQVYTCTFRGNTLVDISPRDERSGAYPLYQRDHLRAGYSAPLKMVSRYVASKPILRW